MTEIPVRAQIAAATRGKGRTAENPILASDILPILERRYGPPAEGAASYLAAEAASGKARRRGQPVFYVTTSGLPLVVGYDRDANTFKVAPNLAEDADPVRRMIGEDLAEVVTAHINTPPSRRRRLIPD